MRNAFMNSQSYFGIQAMGPLVLATGDKSAAQDEDCKVVAATVWQWEVDTKL